MSFEFVSYFGFRASNLHFCLTLAPLPRGISFPQKHYLFIYGNWALIDIQLEFHVNEMILYPAP